MLRAQLEGGPHAQLHVPQGLPAYLGTSGALRIGWKLVAWQAECDAHVPVGRKNNRNAARRDSREVDV